jgi:hypothetical protein
LERRAIEHRADENPVDGFSEKEETNHRYATHYETDLENVVSS